MSDSPTDGARSKALRATALFGATWLVVSVGVFLFLAGFFTAWSGVAVSVRDANPDRSVYTVLIADDSGARFETTWPARAVEGLSLPIDPLALPPKPLPDDLPRTEKARWSMAFTVAAVEDGQVGAARRITTTRSQALAIALLVFVVGFGGRNMMVAGNPFSIEPRGITLPAAQAPAGQISGGSGGGDGGGGTTNRSRPRGRKGPPPTKKRRGGGRRRR